MNPDRLKPVTWDELADLYKEATGRTARTLPMGKVFEWAEKQPNKFQVGKDGCLFHVQKRFDSVLQSVAQTTEQKKDKKMNKFQAAQVAQSYRKIAVFGGPGSGKTILGLSAPGKKMVIDTEGGTLPYAGLTQFDVMHTQSFGEIKAVVDEIQANPPEGETTLIIDSGSLIWSGLQQAMLEKKMKEKGITVHEGTEKVQFALADWGVLKKWHSDIVNTLLTLKCHVVMTFRESEVMDEVTFRKTGVFVPEWEKKTPYLFDFVGRVADRTFTFTKGRLADGPKLIDVVGRAVKLPTIEDGKDLPKLWEVLFGGSKGKPTLAHPAPAAPAVADVKAVGKDPEAIRIGKDIRARILPKFGISNEDFELYLLNKVLKDGKTILGVKGDDGRVHLSDLAVVHLRWLVEVLESDKSRMQLIARVEELKKGSAK